MQELRAPNDFHMFRIYKIPLSSPLCISIIKITFLSLTHLYDEDELISFPQPVTVS